MATPVVVSRCWKVTLCDTVPEGYEFDPESKTKMEQHYKAIVFDWIPKQKGFVFYLQFPYAVSHRHVLQLSTNNQMVEPCNKNIVLREKRNGENGVITPSSSTDSKTVVVQDQRMTSSWNSLMSHMVEFKKLVEEIVLVSVQHNQ